MNTVQINDDILDQVKEMQNLMIEHGVGDLGMWNELCQKHTSLLKKRGFENFKRTVNFEYSQWGVGSYRDYKIRNILKYLLRHKKLPFALLMSSIDIKDMEDIEWSHGKPSFSQINAYKLYLTLLWEAASITDHLNVLKRFQEPLFGNPLKIYVANNLISQDLALSAMELNTIAAHCNTLKFRNVAEIGAGYGRFAWLFMKVYPQVSYSIFDIPPALAISQNYLSSCFDKHHNSQFNSRVQNKIFVPSKALAEMGRFIFRLPYEMESVPEKHFDLIVNISSFDEMPRQEVDKYFKVIDAKLKGKLYLKGYQNNPITGWDYRLLPYKSHWKQIYCSVDPTNERFIEQIFSVNE